MDRNHKLPHPIAIIGSLLVFSPSAALAQGVAPNDPHYPPQWGLHRTDARRAWSITTGSTRVTVTVLDQGIDYTHPDLLSYPGTPYIPDFGGTSGATPLVAGAAALILSANPDLNFAEVKALILDYVDLVSHLEGLMVTGGRFEHLQCRPGRRATVKMARHTTILTSLRWMKPW